MHNYLNERDNFITKCMNRAGIASVDIDGGGVIVQGKNNTKEKELYEIGLVAGGEKRIAIAFNPSVREDKIGKNLYPAVSDDVRNYYNHAGKVVDYFFPQVDVEFGILKYGVEGSTEPVVGDFLVPTVGSTKFTISASAPADTPAFEVVDTFKDDFETGDFTDEIETVYILKTIYNG